MFQVDFTGITDVSWISDKSLIEKGKTVNCDQGTSEANIPKRGSFQKSTLRKRDINKKHFKNILIEKKHHPPKDKTK